MTNAEKSSIIDTHVHVFARPTAEFPREVADFMPADREAPVEELLVEMETHGVEGALLVQTGGSELEQHAYLQHALKTYPDRFRGVGLIPEDTVSPADHMDRLADSGGIIGFRLFNIGGPTDPLADIDVRTFTTYPIWQRAAEKDYVLFLYVGAGEAHLTLFLVDAFPQVRVVFNHLMICPGKGTFDWDDKGRPHVEVDIPPRTFYSTLRLGIYENVCVQMSGGYAFSKEPWPYRDLAGWHSRLLGAFGAERLMWGTDFPWIVAEPGYGRAMGVIDELLPDLGPAERTAIMGGTAKRFLRFPTQ